MNELQKFLKERPAITLSKFAKEAGVSYSLLSKITRDFRPLTPETLKKLRPVMERYGWRE